MRVAGSKVCFVFPGIYYSSSYFRSGYSLLPCSNPFSPAYLHTWSHFSNQLCSKYTDPFPLTLHQIVSSCIGLPVFDLTQININVYLSRLLLSRASNLVLCRVITKHFRIFCDSIISVACWRYLRNHSIIQSTLACGCFCNEVFSDSWSTYLACRWSEAAPIGRRADTWLQDSVSAQNPPRSSTAAWCWSRSAAASSQTA